MTGRSNPRVINGSPGEWRSGRLPLQMTGPQPVADDLPSPRRCADGTTAQFCGPVETTAFLRHLVHDLRGPARALEDIPGWITEDFQAIEAPLPADCVRLLPLLSENASRLDGILSGLGAWIAASDPPRDPRPAADPAGMLAQIATVAGCDADIDVGAIPLASEDLECVARSAFENAVRFNPGPVCVRVTARFEPDHWQLTFLDDGVGPSARDPTTLVPPLRRASVGPMAAGAGFGLAVIDRVVGRYGGQTEFRLGPAGRGALLCLQFPR